MCPEKTLPFGTGNLYAKTHTRVATIPVRISSDVLSRIDAQGRVRSESIRAAIEHYLYCLDRNRGALAEQAIALGGVRCRSLTRLAALWRVAL